MKKVLKRLATLAAVLVMGVLGSAAALATDTVTPYPTPEFDYSEVMNGMGSAMNSMSEGVLSNVLPIIYAGLIIFGLVITVRVGLSLFKRFTGR